MWHLNTNLIKYVISLIEALDVNAYIIHRPILLLMDIGKIVLLTTLKVQKLNNFKIILIMVSFKNKN